MNYAMQNNVATLTLDDGKANVVGHNLMDFLESSLDQADSDKAAAIVLRGREGMFSGGFDLREFEKGMKEGLAMVQRGFGLLIRLYSLPVPLVAACTGHGVAMGAFIIMSCDYRVGTRGSYKFTLPETKISMDLPPILMELTAARINQQHLHRVALMSEVYAPDSAVDAGFLDEVVEAPDLEARVQAVSRQLAELPQKQYGKNKLAVRAATLAAMQANLDEMIEASAS